MKVSKMMILDSSLSKMFFKNECFINTDKSENVFGRMVRAQQRSDRALHISKSVSYKFKFFREPGKLLITKLCFLAIS